MARGWIITKDKINTDDYAKYNREGWVGPRNISDEMESKLRNGGGHHFRMYDDDGELYYEGRAMWSDDDLEEGAYGPLGDFGMPDAGCTRINYTGHPEFDCS